MGHKLSISLDDWRDPKAKPRTDRPPTFDPLYGFPKGRKVREMKVGVAVNLRALCTISNKIREAMRLPIGLRDYCAHKAIPYLKCQRAHAPVAGHYCSALYHEWATCQYEDHLLRIREYTREKRLLQRKLRKEAAADN